MDIKDNNKYKNKKEIQSLDTKNNEISEKYHYDLSHYVENKFSIYPEIKGCINGKTRLEDIFNFLKSYINYKDNKTKCWQNFITKA